MTTDYLNLVLTGSDETSMTFLEWRTLMNGTQPESNMKLIDSAMNLLNQKASGRANGFSFNENTGVLQLMADETPIEGASVTINLSNYYTQEEVDELLDDLASSQTIQEINENAIGNLNWDSNTRELRMLNLNNEQIDEPIEISGGEGGNYDVSYDSETGAFALLENDEVKTTLTIVGGSGGGGSGSTITIDIITPASIVALDGETTTIQYRFASVDEDNDPLTGSYVWKVDNAVIQGASGECITGLNTFDITNYLTYSDRRFTLVVTDSAGTVKTKYWTARKVDIRIESSFNDRITKTAGQVINFNYTPYGSGIEKTIHFKLDGVELTPVTLSLSAISQDYSIPAQTHGAHLLDCWITATVGSVAIETNHIYKDIICVDESSSVPIIGCINRCLPVAENAIYNANLRYYSKDNTGVFHLWTGTVMDWMSRPSLYYRSIIADQYDGTTITYVVYKPGGGISQININTDGTIRTETTSDIVNTLSFRTGTAGVHFIELTTGTTPNNFSISIIMDITELDIEINPVTTGLVFDFNPSGYSNGSINKNAPWAYQSNNNIALTVSNGFDWNNGGFQLDSDGNTYFCVKAGYRAYLSYKLFGTDMKPNGAHFKLIFKTENVKDIDATFLSCLSGNVGLEMNVHEANYKTSTNTLNAPYSEDDIVEFEYNVEPLDTTNNEAKSLIMIYEDGVAYRPMEYDDNHRLYQNSDPANIIIGSDYCDVLIYRMSANENTLTDRNVISNFIADALNAEEMISRYNRNQIYDAATGMLTPESLATACPSLKIIKLECPRFTTNKSDTVKGCNVQCIHKGGDPILDNWYATGCSHSGQGTTSNEYGVAGRNMDIKMNLNTTVITTGVSDVTNGIPNTISGSEQVSKVSLTRNSVPNNYFNIKVNIASSENANNALLAKRYNQFLPYIPVSKAKDAKVKTIMEFANCAVFIKETAIGTDTEGNSYTRQEFQDDQWHFYAIGNIGDSKKTDKTRVCDNTDVNEFVNEILDNTLSNSIFDTGVVNLIVSSLPAVGEQFVDYYVQNNNGTYTHSRYINNAWVTVSNNVSEIINGASAIVSSLPQTGKDNIDYYVEQGNNTYLLYRWNGTEYSTGIEKNIIENTHMATAIAPSQWVTGNEKYDALFADAFDGDGTYELRYAHDDGDLNASIQIWRNMYEWVITSTDTEFVNEIDNWFIKDAVTYFYLFTERYTMTDNRAKNSFWHWSKVYISQAEAAGAYSDVASYYTIDDTKAAIHNGYRFDFWDYDNDTGLGINNSGELKMTYGKEDIDYFDDEGTRSYIFNGAESTLFRRVRLLMHSDLMSMYQSRESAGAWDSNSLINEFDNWQSQFPEELWRLDIERKYMRPYLGTSVDNSIPKTSDRFLKTMLNGKKKYQRRQFERDQAAYMGTRYLASSVTLDQIMFRCNTPSGAVVSPDYTLNIVPYSDMYLSVKFGNSNTTQIRAKAGQTYQINCPYTTMTDTAILIYSASRIQALNDLSRCYVHDNDFSNAVKLQRLIIGNNTTGYSNGFLERLTIGNNKLLEELNIRNCPNLTGSLNLSALGALTTFFAEGTGITAVTFADSGKLVTAYLPDGIIALTMRNLNYINTFNMSYDDIERLTIDGGNLDRIAIATDVIDTATELHFADVNWTLNNTSILNSLCSITNCYLSGTIVVTGSIGDYELANYRAKWADLVFDLTNATIVPYYVVNFKNDNGAVLDTQYVISGGNAVDPITRVTNPISTPTKESSAQYHYTFDEWDSNPNDTIIAGNTDFIATYSSVLRSYTVRWYNGETLLQTQTVDYGSYAEYSGATPTDTSLETYLTYRLFNGWDKSTAAIKENVDAYAQYTEANAPTDKTLDEMTPTELYALIKSGVLSSAGQSNNMIASGDEFDLTMGKDYNFSNVTAQELVSLSAPRTFDGTNYYDTNVKLFDTDKSFTLAIDFKFADATNNAILASCFEGTGFVLRQYNGGNVKWGSSANIKVSNATTRELVVIRKIKGDPKLYVYSSDKMNAAIIEQTLNYSLTTQHEATLTFGANLQSDGYIESYGAGTIYWAKLWMDDLGISNCRNLASWTRESYTIQAAGISEYSYRLFRRSDNNRFVNLCFLTKNLIGTHVMNATNVNLGGWASSAMRTWCNGRIFNALPEQWKLIIAQVSIASTAGNMSTEIVTSNDYVFIPSCKEVGFNVTSTGYVNESEGTFNLFTNDASRIKYLNNGLGSASIWWLRSPYTGSSTNFYFVTSTGSYGSGTANSSYGVCFGFCI